MCDTLWILDSDGMPTVWAGIKCCGPNCRQLLRTRMGHVCPADLATTREQEEEK